jgi:serine/threonine-protein kinase
LQWSEQLLNVLEYLHNHQPPILHRDIKPANLKLTRQGEIFLLDFGLAKGAAGQMSTLKSSKNLRGLTQKYAPIEQFHGRTDPTSDLFSLAATLYHLLTDTIPADAPARQSDIDDGDPDPLRLIESLNPLVSARVAAVIYRAMSMNRRHRHVSATEMKQAFRLAKEEDERFAAEREYRRVEMRLLEQEQDTVEENSRSRGAEVSGRRLDAHLEREVDHRDSQQQRPPHSTEAKSHQGAIDAGGEPPKAPDTIPALRSSVESLRKSTPISQVENPRSGIGMATIASGAQETQIRNDWASTSFAGSRAIGGRVFRLVRNRRVIVTTIAIVAVVGLGLIIPLIWNRSLDPRISVNGTQPFRAKDPLKNNNESASPLPPEGMVYVPGGAFMMGRDDGDEHERPAHAVTLKPFFIDTYEVTREDYKKCIDKGSCPQPQGWIDGSFPEGTGLAPVTGVDWNAANVYAQSVSKRLPSEEEWEFAARGTDGRLYPWGNQWRDGLANANGVHAGVADVGSYDVKAPFGEFDMIGNAWEWTSTRWGPYPGAKKTKEVPNEPRVIRGGTYSSEPYSATATYRRGWPSYGAKDGYANTGFRCASDGGRP